MDAYLAIVSKREVRDYAPRPIDVDAERRILEAGRLAGSAANRQRRRFVVVRDAAVREEVAASVYEPDNVRGAALIVAIVVGGRGPTQFDAGRAAQNMMLAASNEGVGSCPNGVADPDRMGAALGPAEDERVAIVLTFGYPARPRRDPEALPPEEWVRRANRRPYEEVVQEI